MEQFEKITQDKRAQRTSNPLPVPFSFFNKTNNLLNPNNNPSRLPFSIEPVYYTESHIFD